ncbi:hypothetical protein WMY93_018352 [Mugilogobius chulae]|uniref:Fibronectin type-III domain-containing protein n=1 Tax=Mugilogobius chulae TaxID=88201 RepID=A0AAW0NLC7_9GOBI
MDWDVYGEVQYNVTSDQGVSCSSSSLSCELSPVTCGSVYSVEVTAQNSAGPSVPSMPVSFTTVPCPPQNLAVAEATSGSCSFSWDTVAHADRYLASVTNIDGAVKTCNITGTSCDFSCDCGYTYLMSVFALNEAGSSQPGPMINYTTVPCCPTSMNVSLVGTDTLEVEWLPARGAEVYETRAVDSSHTILCNDTAPICVLSYLSCDTPYSVRVRPCNDIRGCNNNCPVHTQDTAACTPTGLSLTQVNSSAVTVSWTDTNRNATFVATATGANSHSCSSGSTSCHLTGLHCGSTYEVAVTATSAAGASLPSYSEMYETEPCCPDSLTVTQVTQAMTNVSWSSAKGAHTFLTELTSTKGHARCHTEDTHCLMGCITCGTNYTVSMKAYSLSGQKADCSYNGFSSSLCCPSGVKMYRTSADTLRVTWRSTPGLSHPTQVNMTGTANPYSCTALPGVNHCDISPVQCGDEYIVVVAPVKADGSTEAFCPHRKYGVTCAAGTVGLILFRGKRSVDQLDQ